MVEVLRALPPCLTDPNDGQVAQPADGKEFRPAGEWWYCPTTGYCFESNGYGHFEGVAVYKRFEDQGVEFEAKPNMWRIRERPGHPLRRCPDATVTGNEELKTFLQEMWSLNHYWASNAIHRLRQHGVVVVTKNPIDDDISIDTGLVLNPKHIEILEVRNYTKEIENLVRASFKQDFQDPRYELTKKEKEEEERVTEKTHESRIRQHEIFIEKARKREEMSNLRERYSKLKDKASAAGLLAHRVDETLENACKDRNLKDITLTKEILDEVEASIDIEIETMAYQAENPTENPAKEQQAEDVEVVEEAETIEAPMPAGFQQLYASAKRAGISEIQLKIWHKQLAGDSEPYTDGVLGYLNKKVGEHLAEAGELESGEPEATEVVEVESEPATEETETKPEEGKALIDMTDEELEEACVSAEQKTEAKGKRKKKTEEEKAAEAEAKAQRAAEAAAKKAEKERAQAEKETRLVTIEDGLKKIESANISNKSNGEIKSFNQVTKQWFDLQIKIKSLELERDTYLAQLKARAAEVEDNEHGFDYCYLDQLAEPVREQFAKQRKERIQPDGTVKVSYEPATVRTQYATFKRNPDDDIICADKGKFQLFLNTLDPATAAFYGGAFYPEYKADLTKLKNLVRDGVEIPGWIENPNPDPVGIPKMELTIHIEKPKAEAKLSTQEEAEESSDTLDASPQAQEEVA